MKTELGSKIYVACDCKFLYLGFMLLLSWLATYYLSPFCDLSQLEENLPGLWGIAMSLALVKCTVHLRHHSETSPVLRWVCRAALCVPAPLSPELLPAATRSTTVFHGKYLARLQLSLVSAFVLKCTFDAASREYCLRGEFFPWPPFSHCWKNRRRKI